MITRDWSTASDDEVMDADVALELGFDKLPEEVALALLKKMGEQVNDIVLRKAIGPLPQEQRDELDQLVAEGNAEAMQTKLLEFVPDYPRIVWEQTVRFKRSMLTESPEESAQMNAIEAVFEEADKPAEDVLSGKSTTQ